MEADLEAGQRRRKRVSEGEEGLRTGECLELELKPNVAGAVVDTGGGGGGGGGGGTCLRRTERSSEKLESEMASDGRLGLKLVSIDCIVDHRIQNLDKTFGFLFLHTPITSVSNIYQNYPRKNKE